MSRIIILHTNDIHGRVEQLARIATRVAEIRSQNPGAPVLYFDVGDSEEFANRLSNLTRGVSMHRLLAAAGCAGVAVGNAVLVRYGPGALAEAAAAVDYPHLAANIHFGDGRTLPGVQPAALFEASGGLRLGVIGLTAQADNYRRFFELEVEAPLAAVREQAQRLREQGAGALIVLSHMGLQADRELAAGLDSAISLVLGGHSHDLLPEGEWAGATLLAQAGQYGEHLGMVELEWDGARLYPLRASVLPVGDDILGHAAVEAEARRIEAEVREFLSVVVAELEHPLELAVERECRLGNLMADALRRWGEAEVALSVAGATFSGGLEAGPLRRETLWEVCPSTGNPGVVMLTGAQLQELVRRGLDPERAAERPHGLRGRARGLLHLSGALLQDGELLVGGEPLDPERAYRVAGSDFEFEPVWGYVEADWGLQPVYQVDWIMRDVLNAYLLAGGCTAKLSSMA